MGKDKEDMTIRLSFEVLLSSEMFVPDSGLVICFGTPVSDWETQNVFMSPKTSKIGANYTLMAGVFDFPRRLMGKTIPYKYVVLHKNTGRIKWEHIHHMPEYRSTVNRCLIVPEVESQFTKFDDVVLSDDMEDSSERVGKGRAEAILWMMPRPKEFGDPDFFLSAALERFEQVLKANKETRVCIGDDRSTVFIPPSYNSTKKLTEIYVERCMECLKKYVGNKNANVGHTLRVATYICLIHSRLKELNFTVDHCNLMFKAFEVCSEKLWEDPSFTVSMDSEMQARACEALKLLVGNFVGLKRQGEDKSRGNWIYVVPFIHRWDLPGSNDVDWLRLDNWKANLRFRYRILFYTNLF